MKLNPMESLGNEGRTQLRQAAGKLGWVSSGSRPDLSFTRVELSTKFNQAQVRDLVAAGKALRNLKSTRSSYFIPSELGNPSKWKIETSCDASFGNLGDKSTAGHIVLVIG